MRTEKLLPVLAALATVAACDSREKAPNAPDRVGAPIELTQIPLSQAAEALADTGAASADPLEGELSGERLMQQSLPMVRSALWDRLRTTRIAIDERTQLFTATHSPAVRSLAGTRVTLRGYMLPLEASDRTTHFLISPYTPVCFFHPPAEPNEVVEVRIGRPVEAGYHLVEVTGILRLADNGDKGLFFVLDEGSARVVERVTE